MWGLLGIIAALAIENTGSPMRVPFACTDEIIEDAGLSCTDARPCPVYLELTGVEATLSRIFLIGNLHTSDATLYSILLVSEDNGKTWTEPQPRARYTSLEQIQFIDFETGWISGANVQGVPRDPFLLISTDGGKSWKERPFFEESRTGVVERFWFESRTDGAALVGTKLRHELYETRTGGESWALRQVSQSPLKLPHDRSAGDSSMRIRADGKLRAYEIEKRQGEKWVSVSAFLVEAARCKE